MRFILSLLLCLLAGTAFGADTLRVDTATEPWLAPDTRLREGSPTYNYGAAELLIIGWASGLEARMLVDPLFLKDVPFGSTVIAAGCSLYANTATAGTPEVMVSTVDTPFVMGVDNGVASTFGVSWGDPGFGPPTCGWFADIVPQATTWTAGGIYGNVKEAEVVPPGGTAGWTAYDMTDVAQAIIDRTAYGIIFSDTTDAGGNEYIQPRSNNYAADPTTRPKYWVIHTPPSRSYSEDTISFTIPNGWNYGRAIIVDGTDRDPQNDFQIPVWINSEMIDTTKLTAYGVDIRFLDEDTSTFIDFYIPLDHWFTHGDSALIWVEAPDLDADADTLFMIYGYSSLYDPTCEIGAVSDCHVGANSNDKYGFASMVAAMDFKDRMLDWSPDLLTNSGDVPLEIGTQADDSLALDSLRMIFDSTGIEMVYGLGNHDNSYEGIAEMLKSTLQITYDDTAGAVPGTSGYYFLAMNANASTLIDSERGDFSAAQLSYIDSCLSSWPAGSIVFFICHQILDAAEVGHDDMTLSQYFNGFASFATNLDYEQVTDSLQSSGHHVIVLQGHVHWLNINDSENVCYFTVPSMAEDATGAWVELTVYGDRFVTFVTRTPDTVWNVDTWDIDSEVWIGRDRDVFILADNVNGDHGQLNELWATYADGAYTIDSLGRLKAIAPSADHAILVTSFAGQDSFIVESSIKLPTAAGSVQSLIGFAVGTEDSMQLFYLAKDDVSAPYIQWKQFDPAWAGVVTIPIDIGFFDESWHTIRLVKRGDIFSFSYDGYILTGGDATWFSALNFTADTLGLWNWNNQEVQFDNIQVREYIDNLPVITVMGELNVAPPAPTLDTLYDFNGDCTAESLEWSEDPLMDSIMVYRSDNGGEYVLLYTVADGFGGWIDELVTDCNSYSYKLKAKNDAGTSDFSNTLSIKLSCGLCEEILKHYRNPYRGSYINPFGGRYR